MVRTNLSVDKDVFEEFADEADRRKITLFAFANASMSTITKVSREGGNPEELYRLWKLISILKQVDVVTLPSDLIESLVRRLYRSDSTFLHERFRQLGSSVVGLLKMEADNVEKLALLGKDFAMLVPLKHFSVTPLKDGRIQVDAAGVGKGRESTECAAEFLKAVIVGYGYLITGEELHTGTIRLFAQKADTR